MVLQYLPLARAMARRATSLPFEDAVQEATIGLIRAADRFDKGRNTAFSTYARYWIAEALQRAIIQSFPVHVPLHVAKASHAKYRRSLADGDLIGGADASAHSGKTEKNRRIDHDFAVTNIRAIRVEMENEKGEPLHADALTQDVWLATENHIDAIAIKAHFHNLSNRQRNALMLYYGIGGHDGYTLEEVGDVMGVSREAVRQLIIRGLGILRGLLQVA
jgi:RNA polymerase sigma factor (sigma-70 family)